ncbi:MAG: nitronate monooxygenase [Dehalococcoidia bacterium]|nr:nitronate monooxygenase [Dehalococcoidia bacterium]
MKTRATELFGVRYPILCGAMMWLAKPELCAAVSNAGGLGNLTAGNYGSGEELRQAIARTRQLTDKPFCVNLTLLPSVRIAKDLHQDYFRVCCEEKVCAIDISGAPLDKYLGPEAIRRAKDAGVKLIHKVGSVKHAMHAEEAGYDAVIAAGFEEGGHPLNEDVTTMLLTPRICQSVRIPVVTAGGIADGRAMAAAMVLGADGVMMASRFIATTECLAHRRVKEELVQRRENDTVMICRSINLQMRALRNAQVEKVLEVEARSGGLEEIIPLIAGERQSAAWQSGDIDCSPFPVGQSIGLIEDVVSCEELLARMMREAGEILARVQQRFVAGPAT